MKVLCVGGPLNGKRVEWGKPTIEVPDLPLPESWRKPDAACLPLVTRQYRIEKIHTPKSMFAIYVDTRLTIEDAILAILDGYGKLESNTSGDGSAL